MATEKWLMYVVWTRVIAQGFQSLTQVLELFFDDIFQVSDAFLVSLERLVVLMVEQHPKLHPKMHYICYVAIVKVYVAVSRHPTVFPDFLSRTGQY